MGSGALLLLPLFLFPLSDLARADEYGRLLDDCEERIAEKLRSPRSYSRVRYTTNIIPMMRGEYLEKILRLVPQAEFTSDVKKKMDLYDAGAIKAVNITVSVKFDSMNIYGVALRNEAYCVYPSLDGTVSGASVEPEEFAIK